MSPPSLSFSHFAADRLAAEQAEIGRQWMDRVRGELRPHQLRSLPGPESDLAAPSLLAAAADFVRDGEPASLIQDAEVGRLLRELVRARRSKGAEPQDLIAELDILADELDRACIRWLGEYAQEPPPAEVVRAAGRLNRAPILFAALVTAAFREIGVEERTDASARLREFADTLVHELNTPLGAAEGAALLLESDDMSAAAQERRRFAGLIQRNLRRARLVISNVRELAFARGERDAPGQRLPIGQVLGEVLVEARHHLLQAGVRIEVQEPVPELVVDAHRMEIVLINLISNAAKYSDPARRDRWVRIAFEPEEGGDHCWIEVSDNGLGVPAEHQDQLFERFFRAHPDRADGSGLGLAIVREAVQQMGGEIELRSEPGVGTTFRICVPSPG